MFFKFISYVYIMLFGKPLENRNCVFCFFSGIMILPIITAVPTYCVFILFGLQNNPVRQLLVFFSLVVGKLKLRVIKQLAEPHHSHLCGATSRSYCLPATLVGSAVSWSGPPELVSGGKDKVPWHLWLCPIHCSLDNDGKHPPKSSLCLVQEIFGCLFENLPFWDQTLEGALRDNTLGPSQCPK